MSDHPAGSTSVTFPAWTDDTLGRCPDCGSEAGFVVPEVVDGPSVLDPSDVAWSGRAATSPERACADCGLALLVWDPAAGLRIGDPVADAAIIELAGVAARAGADRRDRADHGRSADPDGLRRGVVGHDRDFDAALDPEGADPDAALLALIGDPLLADLAIGRRTRRPRGNARDVPGVA